MSSGPSLLIEMPGTSHRGALPPADSALCELAEELRRDIRELAVDIGERNVRHRPQQLARAADYIEAEFAAAGYAARRQEYNVESVTCCNVDVEIVGATRPQ